MMKTLLITIFILTLLTTTVIAQVANIPVCTKDMVQISYDGVAFQDAAGLVTDISVSIGTAGTKHIAYAKRGEVTHWEAQIGQPYETYMAEWYIDTSLIPVDRNMFYIRFRFGVQQETMIYSPWSESSAGVNLIGKPGKPARVE